jgi:RNA polymerase sigma-70 factor (ECF subfamily)
MVFQIGISTYYRTIIINLSMNYLRDNKRLLFIEDYTSIEYEHLAGQETVDLADMLSTKEKFDMAIQAINNLPDIYKDTLMLHYINDLSDEEISAILDISMGNVRLRIFRALRMLEIKMKGVEDNGR